MGTKEVAYNTAYQFFKRTGDETRLNAVREKYGMEIEDRDKNKERNKKMRKMRKTETCAAVAKAFGLSVKTVFQICGKMGRPVKNPQPSQTISIYLGFEAVEKIRRLSRTENKSVSKILMPVILDFLEKEGVE